MTSNVTITTASSKPAEIAKFFIYRHMRHDAIVLCFIDSHKNLVLPSVGKLRSVTMSYFQETSSAIHLVTTVSWVAQKTAVQSPLTTMSSGFTYNTIQYNIRLIKVARTQLNNTDNMNNTHEK